MTDTGSCRSCGHGRLFEILDLGATPVANALVADASSPADPIYPLEMVGCPVCGLAQLADDLPRDAIFDQEYPYFSSFSTALLEHSQTHCEALVRQFDLGAESLVVEVASNDGYLLRNFVDLGVPCLGIEPSPGPAAAARAAGIETLEAFFGRESADEVVRGRGRADVVIANNVLAHVPDIKDFVAALATLVADDGVISIENPALLPLVDNHLFDTIYHEHYSYLSSTSIAYLAGRHGLHLNDVEPFPELHGGTLRWRLSGRPGRTAAAEASLAREAEWAITSPQAYSAFRSRADKVRTDLRSTLVDLRNDGARVAAYGCAAKGATLLNSSQIGNDLVAYVVDRNPLKQGKLMPGCRVPCYAPDTLLEDQPDVVLMLAWNVADEVIEQQREYLDLGGSFLIPLPEMRMVRAA